VILLLRALSRAVAFVLLVALAVGCLVAAGFAVTRSGLPALGDLVGTDTAAGHSRDFLARLERGDQPADAAGAAALAALVGVLLVAGAVLPRRERTLAVAEEEEQEERGRLAARRRPLQSIAEVLAARPASVNRARARIRGHYRRPGGRLRIRVGRVPGSPEKPVVELVDGEVEGLAKAFGLRTKVRTRLDERRRPR
jgi:hypothetical protein